MIRQVIQYGNSVLRKKGERVEAITPTIRMLIDDLLETMDDANGIGLAAQQVGEVVQVTVVDVRGADHRPSSLEIQGRAVRVEDFMPMVLINPEVKPIGELVSGVEGCLSFPEIFADVSRPEAADVVAVNENGGRVEFRCDGLLCRAIQHEVDHLNGILFIDRMDVGAKAELRSRLAILQARTKMALQAHAKMK